MENLVNANTVPKLGKFDASKRIVKESWAVLKQDQEIFLFPILSAITGLIVFGLVAFAYYVFGLNSNLINWEQAVESKNAEVYGYAALFVYYVIMFFIVNFFDAGILTIAYGRFQGKDLAFADGIHGATENAGKILGFSIIAATVGVILNIIASRGKILGRIVANILGAAWNILTYFSLPSLVIGKTSVRNSFYESAAIMKKTWGETIIVELGVGLFFAVIFLITFVVGMGIILLYPTPAVMVAMGILMFIILIGLIIVGSALGIIFKLALYEYARTGQMPKGFSPELIQNAIKKT